MGFGLLASRFGKHSQTIPEGRSLQPEARSLQVIPVFSALLNRIFTTSVILALLVGVGGLLDARQTPAPAVVHRATHDRPTVAYKWLEVLLEASGRDVDRHGARPTILSRTMAIVLTSMYDAWAAYDDTAIGTRLGGTLRRPRKEQTQKNKETAISYAAFRSLLDVYPEDSVWIRDQMRSFGYNPDDQSLSRTSPAGIGNVAAAAVSEFRHHDGANQLGDVPGGDGNPYSDYTSYRPKNTPDNIVDPLAWLPIEFSDGKGGHFSPGFLTPHWYRVKPFALARSDQFRPPAPPSYGSDQLRREVDEAIAVNAGLTLEQKAIVEFMRDGPRSTGQSGHWLQFAQDVSRRDRLDLDQDIKLFFAVGNVVFDAFVSCWDAKRFYDTSRPYWWVRILYRSKTVRGWRGPGLGVGEIAGEKWRPYSPATFVTPPFPGYVSGHAAASGAASKILELFTGSDYLGAAAPRIAGALTEEEFEISNMQSRDGKPPKDLPRSKEVVLQLPTFSGTAEMAAVSRLWGGYHIRTDNEEGLKLGRKIAEYSWPIYVSYFKGVASPRKISS
jgi:hypothetical protein